MQITFSPKSDLKIQVAAIGAWDPSREALEAKRRAKGEVGGRPGGIG